MKIRSVVNLSFFILIFLAISLVVYSNRQGAIEVSLVGHQNVDLFEKFSATMKSIGGRDTELGETETVRDAINSILRFDKAGFWKVPTDSGVVWIYLAYWSPGKQSIREIAFHTPDHCWVNAGWARVNLPLENSLNDNEAFLIGKQRCFTSANISKSYVAYWHIFGDQVITYGDRPVPSDWSLLTSIWNVGLNQRKAQWFIRIHSERSLSEFKNTKAISALTALINDVAPGLRVLSVE
jgi:hypothetical protein